MHMVFINSILSSAVAYFAYRAGADWPVVAIAFWAAYRVEVALTNQFAACKLLSVLVQAEASRVVVEQARHETQVAHIARNN